MSAQPIKRWIILFSGFRQDASEMTGTIRAWRTLYERHAGPTSVVAIHPWNTHARMIAHMVRNNRNGEMPDVVLGGYSFGGQTAVNVAEQLRLCGIFVRQLVLSDPVYRHNYYAGWWRSLMPFSTIYVPPNVQRVKYFLQENTRFWPLREGGWIQPAGHRLVAEVDEKTGQRANIRPPVYLPHDHSNMDDAGEYHKALLEACECSA
jgi:pimeloyl-ACP methyl ester carboxylesterase